jgi:ParE toxin of type II toxin-antitoxin system, parDE
MGKAADDLPIEGVLRFVMGDYLVDYQLETDLIRVLKIRHGRQSAGTIADDGEIDFEDTGPDV